jgi:biopolymer transport protein ExbD
MAIGQFTPEEPAKTISEINTTPFVDVMLVLLIIFIITAPLMSQGLPLNLPQADAPSLPTKSKSIRIEITAQGEVSVDGQAIGAQAAAQAKALESLLTEKANSAGVEAQVEIRADGATAYARVAEVIAASQAVGLRQIGLVTLPVPQASERRGRAPESPQTR